MRTAGFPCRVASCDQSFKVADQNSMQALAAASSARSDHEITVHDYHHAAPPPEPARSWAPRIRPRDSK